MIKDYLSEYVSRKCPCRLLTSRYFIKWKIKNTKNIQKKKKIQNSTEIRVVVYMNISV